MAELDSIPSARFPAHDNPVIANCLQAWNKAFVETPPNSTEAECLSAANKAFLRAIPPLDSEFHIRSFIACVSYALLIDAVSHQTATRLLYAAQVAKSALPRPPAAFGRPVRY